MVDVLYSLCNEVLIKFLFVVVVCFSAGVGSSWVCNFLAF